MLSAKPPIHLSVQGVGIFTGRFEWRGRFANSGFFLFSA
jgi:hypothetical protein